MLMLLHKFPYSEIFSNMAPCYLVLQGKTNQQTNRAKSDEKLTIQTAITK